MDPNLSLFNQINSLSYWFLIESKYKNSVIFDAENDMFFIKIKKGKHNLYSHHIGHFSKKNKKFLHFELKGIVNSLLHIKDVIMSKQNASA